MLCFSSGPTSCVVSKGKGPTSVVVLKLKGKGEEGLTPSLCCVERKPMMGPTPVIVSCLLQKARMRRGANSPLLLVSGVVVVVMDSNSIVCVLVDKTKNEVDKRTLDAHPL